NHYVLLDIDSLKIRLSETEQSNQLDSDSLKNSTDESSGLDANYTKYLDSKELDSKILSRIPEKQSSGENLSSPNLDNENSQFQLSSDRPNKKSKAADERFAPFKEKLCKFYKYVAQTDLYWTAADSKQLFEFLRVWPKLTLEAFHKSLENYMESENIVQTKTP